MNYTFAQFFKDFYIFLEGQRVKFFFFLVLRYISEVVPYLSLFILGLIISHLSQNTVSLQTIYMYVGIIVIASIFQTTLRFYSKYNLYKIGTIVGRNIRLLSMNHLLRLDLSWHEDQNTGEKIQKINSGTDEIQKIFHSIANEWIFIFSGITASIFVFLFINPFYSFFIISMLVVFFLIYKSFMPRLMQLRKENQILKEKVNGTFTESAYSISSIKTPGLHSHITNKSTSVEEAYKEKSLQTKRASQIRTVILLSLASISAGLFLIWIVHDYLSGAFAIGMILTYYIYFGRYLDAQHKGIWAIQDFVDAKVIFERLMTILGSQEFRENELGKKKITTRKNLIFTGKLIEKVKKILKTLIFF
ncbi:MAG: ABC transporter transmembrane domain-containing protein [Candidatus Woesearchaeota archaeon]